MSENKNKKPVLSVYSHCQMCYDSSWRHFSSWVWRHLMSQQRMNRCIKIRFYKILKNTLPTVNCLHAHWWKRVRTLVCWSQIQYFWSAEGAGLLRRQCRGGAEEVTYKLSLITVVIKVEFMTGEKGVKTHRELERLSTSRVESCCTPPHPQGARCCCSNYRPLEV